MILLWLLIAIKSFIFTWITGVEEYYILISLMTVLISWILIGLVGRLPGQGRKWGALIVYTLISIAFFSDAMYFSYFKGLLTIETITQQAQQVGTVTDTIFVLLTIPKLLLIVDLPLVLIFNKFISKWSSMIVDKWHLRIFGYGKEKQPGMVIIVLLILAMLNYAFLFEVGAESTLFAQEFYHFHTGNIAKVGPIYAEEEEEEAALFTLEDFEELQENARLKEGKWTGIAEGKNLIVIQVESLQNFVINLEVDGQVVTPNLNKLIETEGSVYYDNYFHITSRGSTSDAEFVTNNSLHPSSESPTFTQYDDNTFYGLPWLSRDYDYTPWVFHGYDETFWNRDVMYPVMGFERFVGAEDYNIKEEVGFGITDKEFFRQSMDYLKELDELDDNPFYAFMITLTSHTPYEMPMKYQELTLPSYIEGTYLGNYLQAIHYTDAAIGEFIENLKKEGLYKDSVIAIYGDHYGVQVLSDEINNLMVKFLGERYWGDIITNVPLILRIPNLEGHHVISDTGSMMDFYPTIQNLLAFDNTKGMIFGEDLNNITEPHIVMPQTILRRGSFITDDYMYSIKRDEIFANGSAYTRPEHEEIDDLEPLRPLYEETIKSIGLGEYILRNDLIKYTIKGEDLTPLVENDFSFLDESPLYRWHDGELETLKEAYRDGVKQVIVGGKWKRTKRGEDLGKERLLYLGDDGTGDELSDVLAWLRFREDFTLIIENGPYEDESFFGELSSAYKKSPELIVPCITTFEEHFYVVPFGFHHIVIDLSHNNSYDSQELEDFLSGRYLPGVILPEGTDIENVNADLAQGKVLFFQRMDEIVETVEDEEEMEREILPLYDLD